MSIDTLIETVDNLIARGNRVWGPEGTRLRDEELLELRNDYQEYQAEALDILPDDLKQRFFAEYEGTDKEPKIKQFLSGPRQKEPVILPIASAPRPQHDFSTGTPRLIPPAPQRSLGSGVAYTTKYPTQETFISRLASQRQILLEAKKRQPVRLARPKGLLLLERIAQGLPDFISQLQQPGHGGRAPFLSATTIQDEYDIQALLRALLPIFFDNVKTEEVAPSYAGGSSRIDFLLVEEGIAVEVKHTRKGLNDAELGRQLTLDRVYYQKHPDCNALVAIVYDPERRIKNSVGVQNDLREIPGLDTHLCVVR